MKNVRFKLITILILFKPHQMLSLLAHFRLLIVQSDISISALTLQLYLCAKITLANSVVMFPLQKWKYENAQQSYKHYSVLPDVLQLYKVQWSILCMYCFGFFILFLLGCLKCCCRCFQLDNGVLLVTNGFLLDFVSGGTVPNNLQRNFLTIDVYRNGNKEYLSVVV